MSLIIGSISQKNQKNGENNASHLKFCFLVAYSLVLMESAPRFTISLVLFQGIALRGLFIIDKEGVIQHSTINNLGIGRSVDETLRTLQV